MKKEHEIGETFVYQGREIKVCKAITCKNCAFWCNVAEWCWKPDGIETCASSLRKDRNNVIFVDVTP